MDPYAAGLNMNIGETGAGCNTGHGAIWVSLMSLESDYKSDLPMNVAPHAFQMHVPAKSVLLYPSRGWNIQQKLFLITLVNFVKSETFMFMRGCAWRKHCISWWKKDSYLRLDISWSCRLNDLWAYWIGLAVQN